MSRVAEQLEGVRDHFEVSWDERKWEGLEASVRQRIERRTRRRRVIGAAAGVVTLVCAALVLWPSAPSQLALDAPVPRVTAQTGSAIELSDGSTVTPLSPTASVQTAELSARRTRFDVQKGAARFVVAPQKQRSFQVVVGDVVVNVVGTVFSVERLNGGARVSVEHGKVSVAWRGQSTTLNAGQSKTFGAQKRTPEEPEAVDVPVSPKPVQTAPRARDWRELARAGEFESAYKAIQSNPGAVGNKPGDLMLAADVARLSGHPGQAVAPLRRILSQHSGDPRASLAAFTLGRVLLEELGRPHEAASAFRRARATQPGGPLAQDALAREVEAWSRAGEVSQAERRAREYVRLYPKGSKVKSVRRFGNLER